MAGSTGRLGLRIVRQLLLDGFNVRAGARNTKKAKEYVELATSLGVLPAEAVKRLKIVSVDFEDQQTILPAIGNAEKVFPDWNNWLAMRQYYALLEMSSSSLDLDKAMP